MTVSYTTVSAKLGKVKSETRSISRELFDAAAKAGHEIWYMWGMGSSSEHATGLALDLMVRNEAGGDFVRNYIWNHRKRLRLQHVIWEQHITSTVTSPGARRKMADRGSVTENHMDHVHVLFFAGEYRAPDSSAPAKKPITEVAKEVIRGEWGNGNERVTKLRKAGYNYDNVQAEVSRIMHKKKGTTQIAKEVIAGDWGNDPHRSKSLLRAGYDPANIQREVNRLLGN